MEAEGTVTLPHMGEGQYMTAPVEVESAAECAAIHVYDRNDSSWGSETRRTGNKKRHTEHEQNVLTCGRDAVQACQPGGDLELRINATPSGEMGSRTRFYSPSLLLKRNFLNFTFS